MQNTNENTLVTNLEESLEAEKDNNNNQLTINLNTLADAVDEVFKDQATFDKSIGKLYIYINLMIVLIIYVFLILDSHLHIYIYIFNINFFK